MIGYYDIDECDINNNWINIKDNMYEICCPLVVKNKNDLPIDLLCLYETLDIPIINIKDINNYKKEDYEEYAWYIKVLSFFLKMNVDVEINEEQNVGHLLRVARMAKELAMKINLDDKEVKDIFVAALFHDLGKVLIPDSILNKNSKLTNEEYEIMKKHSEYAEILLKDFLNENVVNIIRHHHERINKSGYPDHLVPSIGAKIIGIVDSYDAMCSNRVYHEKMSKDDALNELLKCSMDEKDGGKGKLYDSKLVLEFIELIKNT